MPASAYDAVLGDNLTLRQCESVEVAPNARISRGRQSAATLASAIFFDGAEPRCRFSTTDIANALNSSTGLDPTTGLLVEDEDIILAYQERDAGGVVSGSNHLELTATYGLIIPTSVQASQGEAAARLDLEAALYSDDGLVHPFALVNNGALASGAFNAQHRMGPVYIDSTQLATILRFTVNFGLTIKVHTTDGDNYPTRVTLEMADPTIDLVFENAKALSAYTALFKSMTSCACYLRKKADGSSLVAEATEEHISFAFGTGIQEVTPLSASGSSHAEPGIRLHGKELTVSTTSAMPGSS